MLRLSAFTVTGKVMRAVLAARESIGYRTRLLNWANKRLEPMRGSAVRLVLYSGVCGALLLMAQPHR